MQRVFVVLAASLALFATGAAHAQDHNAHAGHQAEAVRTTPADGAMGAAPQTFTAVFPHAMRLTSLTVARNGGAPQAVSLAADAAPSTTVTAPLPALGAGNYVFTWSATGADGHVMSGAVRYMVH